MDIDLLLAFVSGFLIGLTPCTVLILSVIGGSSVLLEDKSKYIRLSVGLISGCLIAYILISIIFVAIIDILNIIYLFRYIFAGVLVFIGVWQIVECKKEKSIIFGTPKRIKSLLKNFIDKRTGLYSFLIGIIFVFVKIPCFSGVYLSLLYNFWDDPSFYSYIILYLAGLMIPMIIILLLLRVSLSFDRVNEIRLKYRPYLRLLNGTSLIVLTLYLLFF